MKKLTKFDKMMIIAQLRSEGWVGCECDECLLLLAQRILDAQLSRS
jgi:hypothetical protein